VRSRILAACCTVYSGSVTGLTDVIRVALGSMLSSVALISVRPGPMARTMNISAEPPSRMSSILRQESMDRTLTIPRTQRKRIFKT
jgi:hypothetical protein